MRSVLYYYVVEPSEKMHTSPTTTTTKLHPEIFAWDRWTALCHTIMLIWLQFDNIHHSLGIQIHTHTKTLSSSLNLSSAAHAFASAHWENILSVESKRPKILKTIRLLTIDECIVLSVDGSVIAVGRAEVHWSSALYLYLLYLHNRFVIVLFNNKRDQNETIHRAMQIGEK